MTMRFTGALAFAWLAFAAPVGAEVTATDLQVAARALSFMEDPLRGVVQVGILYEPGSPRSVRQAQELERLLGGGLRAGALELRPQLVELERAAHAGVEIFFLTEYVDSAAALAADLGAAKGRPCVTLDLEQVRSGACLMGVRSKPKIEIVVNRAAAQASGIAFATVFRVMITEI